MSASPAIDPAAPVKGPDIIDHLKSSERLMNARELASILAISPKTIYSYSYAERNMIPHFNRGDRHLDTGGLRTNITRRCDLDSFYRGTVVRCPVY